MKNGIFVGVDTSNYTTSVGVVDTDGAILANLKLPLPVKCGERGLRQSDAVFAHVKNLPVIMDELKEYTVGKTILGVGVSTRPRNKEGSYMPCFLAGVGIATAIATSSGAPLYEFSHQCGHIMAAIRSAEVDVPKRFAAFHISGGTTELVDALWNGKDFVCDTLGGTSDLNAGQIIDRVGVYMGMPFPSGKYMEAAALKNKDKIPKKKVSVSGTNANLSGLENMATKLYDETKNIELTAAFVFEYLGAAIVKVCENAKDTIGDVPFVFAGGVMSNSIIKEKLSSKFNAIFAEPELSKDNAVGVAILAKNAYNYNKRTEA